VSTLDFPIADLPTDLSFDEAVEAAYRDQLDWIERKLRQNLSVLVECDKQLTNYVYKALRRRFRQRGERNLRLLAGHPRGEDDASAPLPTRLLNQLREAVYGGGGGDIAVLTHLDVLTTTTNSSLGLEAREAAAIMYENPEVVFLGFRDPSFQIPSVIEKVFAVERSLLGVARERLTSLILQREARKLGVDHFNPFRLYKYVSGLNAVRCRQLLAELDGRLDYDPEHPDSAEAIYADIREMTVVADLEIPRVDLDEDVGGYAQVKEQLRTEILELLRIKEAANDRETIENIEEIMPKAMILHGPPGTGKTFLAKAMATALDATVSVVSGPELKSKWVGESEQNLRRVFARARKSAPSLIIFDELDSFASSRQHQVGTPVGHSMVNQLLTEMDGFRSEELVFIVGTTNFVESLDPALLRPGRFELAIELPYPSAEDRREILEIYLDKFGLELSDELLDYAVERTAGFVDEARSSRFSGDHLYAIIRSLKRQQLRNLSSGSQGGALEFTKEHVDEAIGTRKKKRPALQEEEERTVAIHEAGHAILAWVLPHCPSVKRVTITDDRDDYLGYVMQDIARRQYVRTRKELLDDICVSFGGRAAEALLLGEVSIGAWQDLQQATAIARMMVEQWGMSEELPLRVFADADGGRPTRPRLAEATAAKVDEAIAALLDEQKARAEEVLERHRPELEVLAERLIDQRSLGPEELAEIFDGRTFKN
jgi:cell division protease FtsH